MLERTGEASMRKMGRMRHAMRKKRKDEGSHEEKGKNEACHEEKGKNEACHEGKTTIRHAIRKKAGIGMSGGT